MTGVGLYSCVGKVPLTADIARKVAGRHGRQRKHQARQPYRCPFCHAWHVGAKPEWKKKILL